MATPTHTQGVGATGNERGKPHAVGGFAGRGQIDEMVYLSVDAGCGIKQIVHKVLRCTFRGQGFGNADECTLRCSSKGYFGHIGLNLVGTAGSHIQRKSADECSASAVTDKQTGPDFVNLRFTIRVSR